MHMLLLYLIKHDCDEIEKNIRRRDMLYLGDISSAESIQLLIVIKVFKVNKM